MINMTKEFIEFPEVNGVLKFSVTIDFEMNSSNIAGKHFKGLGGIYDPAKLKHGISLADVLLRYISGSFTEIDYKTVSLRITDTDGAAEFFKAHDNIMREINAEHVRLEKAMQEKRNQELLAREADIRADLAKIKKLKSQSRKKPSKANEV